MNKKEFQESDTIVNLSHAFLRESQNGARCEFMSAKAKEEKHCYLEELLKKQKCRHLAVAKVFYEAIEENMEDLGIEVEIEDVYPFRKASFEENFENFVVNAEEERDEIYPEFEQTAREEGFKEIEEKFAMMHQIKDCFIMMMKEIGDKLKNKTLYKVNTAKKWKCDNCGHEHMSKEAWKMCPFCGFEQGHVIIELSDEKEN